MGGAVSAGRDNNELVEKLVRARYLRTPHVHRVYRAVDRADYFLPLERKRAYEDLAWKSGLLHLSSPCIYCDVMEGLRLKPGLSFLNLGSGTGYLSTMAGLILGTGGINHGVELYSEVVDYAYERLSNFLSNSPAVDEFDFCEPKFVVGNCLCLTPTDQQYDRVYCGAACPLEYESYVKNLIKVGGILVMPSEDNLLWIKRISETQWETKKLHCVSFSTLVSPTEKQSQPTVLPEMTPAPLQVLCRATIRNVLRNVIAQEEPALLEALMKSDTTKKRKRNHVKTFCLSVNEDDSDSDEFNRLHSLEPDSGSHEMNALLRLVLSMGNQTRQFDLDSPTSGDSSDSSSSDDDSSTDVDTSSQSSVFDGIKIVHCGNKSNCDPDLEPNTENKETDMNEEHDSQPNTSEEGSKTSEESNDTFSCVNVPLSDDSEDTKRNKFDSGIVEDIAKTTEEDSDVIQMDTSSSDDLSDADNGNGEGITGDGGNDAVEKCRHRKRHLDNLSMTAERYSECGNSSDSDSDKRVVTQSKIKRKSPVPPHPYDMHRKALSNLLRKKIEKLHLPPSLKSYVNMNKKLPL